MYVSISFKWQCKTGSIVPAKEWEKLSLFPRVSREAVGSSLQDQNFSLLWVIDHQVRKEKPRFLKYNSTYRPVSLVLFCWQSDSKHVIKLLKKSSYLMILYCLKSSYKQCTLLPCG